jgi:hypothetical protein
MKLISHRGNLNGKNIELENEPSYISDALSQGFDVEIDVWFKNGKFFLGHDYPKYEVVKQFLKNKSLWCHAKNIECLYEIIDDDDIHSFWHQKDDVTLTSKNILWTYPGQNLTKKSVCVLPEKTNHNLTEIKKCFGVCSDFVKNYI